MLIVCNGAFKSGSTWLFNIVRDLTGATPPPAEYLNPAWRNPSLHPDKIAALLEALTPAERFIVKNHFNTREQRDLLLSHPDVRVLNITRDLRDMTVSAYYHARRVDNYQGDFASYYEIIGRAEMLRVARYHRIWSVPSPHVYTASYERLHADFFGEVRDIARFLGVSVSDMDIDRLRRETSLDSLRQKYGEADAQEKFFRKGVVGDWRNHFTPEMAADLHNALREQERQATLPYRIIRRLKRMLRRTP